MLSERTGGIADAGAPGLRPVRSDGAGSAAATCVHCGGALPSSSSEPYCCAGCRTVHHALSGAGLLRYYELRGDNVAPVPDLRLERRDRKWLEPVAASLANADAAQTLSFKVQGVRCAACVWLIQELFGRVPGSGRIIVNPGRGSLEMMVAPDFPLEVFLQAGTDVPAGAFNAGLSALRLQVRTGFAASQLAELLARPRVERAQTPRRYHVFSGLYVLGVFSAAAAGFLYWTLVRGDLVRGLEVVTAVCVVTCPCAIGIATPLAYDLVLSGLRRAGLFVRSSTFLDRALQIRRVVFDKTGTLTTGRLALADRSPLERLDARERDALYTLVCGSLHPKSLAAQRALEESDARLLDADVTETPGRGVELSHDGACYRFGQRAWAAAAVESSEHVPGEDLTFGVDGRERCTLRTCEAHRPDAQREIARLERAGYETSIFYFNFFWFREQLCLIVCPYGRRQSVLTDQDTVIIGYDVARGEPRGKAGTVGAGACVDCKRCLVVCPTGIDIRNGLQIDCIGCARCIDACDEVMDKLDRPRGLVRYDSQNGLSGLPKRLLRPRVYLYVALGLLGATALGIALVQSKPFEANVLRLRDAPAFSVDHGRVRNSFEVHLVNKRAQDTTFRVHGAGSTALSYIISIPRITLSALGGQRIPIFVEFPLGAVHDGDKARIEIVADHGPTRVLEPPLLAPDGR